MPTNQIQIQVPADYGYVLLTAASSYLLSTWLGVRIGPFRSASHIPHPHISATPEAIAAAPNRSQQRSMYLFNCAQRAHHNFIENYPAALSALLVSGLAYPRLAAAAGAVWMVGRVVYALGYTRRAEWNVEGKGRFSGGGFYVAAVGQVVLMGLVGKMGVELLGA